MSIDENVLPEGAVALAGSVPVAATSPVALTQVAYVPAPPQVLQLPDGRKIGMARPNISLTALIANILADFKCGSDNAYETERQRVKSLLFITDIDGIPVIRPTDAVTRAHLEQQIGDEFLDPIAVRWLDMFPPIDPGSLKALKKS